MVRNASLCLFSVDPQWNHPYFWLVKNEYCKTWPEGNQKWGMFGGRVREEEDYESVAAREFWEESMGMIQYYSMDVLPRKGFADIELSLCEKSYLFRFWIPETEHVVYLKQIPWDPAAIPRFLLTRSLLLAGQREGRRLLDNQEYSWILNHPAFRKTTTESPKDHTTSHPIHNDLNEYTLLHRSFMEKTSLGMWSLPQLLEALMQTPDVKMRLNERDYRSLSSIVPRLPLLFPSLMSPDAWQFCYRRSRTPLITHPFQTHTSTNEWDDRSTEEIHPNPEAL